MPTFETPNDPFSLVPQRPLNLTGKRSATVFGGPVEIVCLPDRLKRGSVPGTRRPGFLPDRAAQILSEEEVWCAPGVAMTGNAFPFTDRQAILWATDFRREPSIAMLEVAYAIEDDVKGTTVVNSLGAAGSVSRSHIHLLGETNQFFASIPKSMLDPEQLHIGPEELGGCELWRLDPPFPITAVGVRGAPPQRARVVHHLLGSRSTSSFNLIGSHQTCWLVPRSAIETPAPHFNQALGGAELWGRWCFTDREAYERATSAELEAALRLAGTPWA